VGQTDAAGNPPASPRTTLKRGPTRANYDPETVRGILAEGLYCNVAICLDGHPATIPTAYAVHGDQLYLHGSTANRIFRALKGGAEACLSVTLLDGLVLARSAFHHSMNYRSVVIYGVAREVTDREEKLRAFDALIDHAVPGRSREVRAANREEFLRTLVVALPIDEASAKIRRGPPLDGEEDYALDVWAGELPLRTRASEPVTDERSRPEVPAAVLERQQALSG
jgi:nitroimidazol reductase NimA-like FMN-containing flavoprotein (pyridoxamine 5'-phosphate oxidase superfamily)